VERNPGFEGADDPQQASQQGYFYYLYSMARALDAYEEATGKPLVVRDADGRSHNWRAEIARALLARQAEDGSWQNEVATRWEEGSKTLATGFAMQTLGYVTGRLD
jgi:squalene-hopene/tetraprenyl-beta-curcumene cyclase